MEVGFHCCYSCHVVAWSLQRGLKQAGCAQNSWLNQSHGSAVVEYSTFGFIACIIIAWRVLTPCQLHGEAHGMLQKPTFEPDAATAAAIIAMSVRCAVLQCWSLPLARHFYQAAQLLPHWSFGSVQ
jgi:hypothetical protein